MNKHYRQKRAYLYPLINSYRKSLERISILTFQEQYKMSDIIDKLKSLELLILTNNQQTDNDTNENRSNENS